MKKTLIISFILIAFPIFILAQNNDQTVIFMVDKSTSMKKDSKQDKFISKIVRNFAKKGNVNFKIHFVNSNSANIYNSKLFSYTFSVFDSSSFEKDEQDLQRSLHTSKVNRERRSLTKRIIKFVNSYEATANSTNLVSSLVQISSSESSHKTIFYFTDGIECSREFRCMEASPFKSISEAEISARNDAKKLAEVYKLPKNIEGVDRINFVLPIDMKKKQKSGSFIRQYWTTFFSYFGLSDISFIVL